MSKRILGLDIRYNAVSAVLIQSSIKENWIESHEYAPLSDPKEFAGSLTGALEAIFAKIDPAGAQCVASFPADQISFRNLKVPFKKQKKISQILPFEIESTLPFPVDDLIIDFQTLKIPFQTDSTDESDIIAAAVDKSGLKSYLDILAGFKVEPDIITAGGYPVALCLSKLADTPEHFLVADIGPGKSTVSVINSGQICLIRSFPISSDTTSRAVSIGINIRQTLSAFEEMLNLDFQPSVVFITGCGLSDPSMEQDMARALEIPVQKVDMVYNTTLALKNDPEDSWHPEQMDNAFALALIEAEGLDGLNFRKGPFAAKKLWDEHKKSFIKIGILAGLMFVLAMANIMIDSYSMEKKLARLNYQINDVFKKTFPKVKKIVDPLQQMRLKIQKAQQTSLLPIETGKHILMIDILNDISKGITKDTDVEFTRLVIGSGNVLITGNTDTFNSVDDMKSRLEKVEYFKKITISSANIERSSNRIRFNLKVQL